MKVEINSKTAMVCSFENTYSVLFASQNLQKNAHLIFFFTFYQKNRWKCAAK